MTHNASNDPCRCCATHVGRAVTRRGLLTGAAGAAVFPALPISAAQTAGGRQAPITRPIKVQPVLVYDTPQRAEARSWRNWGGIETEQAGRRGEGAHRTRTGGAPFAAHRVPAPGRGEDRRGGGRGRQRRPGP
jgi:hypothetical protein